jgi:hypothetical protein
MGCYGALHNSMPRIIASHKGALRVELKPVLSQPALSPHRSPDRGFSPLDLAATAGQLTAMAHEPCLSKSYVQELLPNASASDWLSWWPFMKSRSCAKPGGNWLCPRTAITRRLGCERFSRPASTTLIGMTATPIIQRASTVSIIVDGSI